MSAVIEESDQSGQSPQLLQPVPVTFACIGTQRNEIDTG